MSTTKSIIESLLFVSETPLTVDQIRKAIPEADRETINAALGDIRDEFSRRQGGFFLQEVAGGYQFRTPPANKEWIRRLVQPAPARLSRAALETLAIIAYRQPVMRSEIEHIRGVNSGATIRMLLDRKLVRILGRRDIPGRPLVYATTQKFLETFSLKDLNDLPTPKDIEDPQTPAVPGQQGLPFKTDTGASNSSENNP
jgi:segregation and condensation protein B